MTSRNVRTSFGLRSGAAVLAVAGTLLMAGCSGGAPADPGTGSPTPSQSASPSVPPTPTPTPSAVYKPADASGPAQNVPVPVLPEVAKTETKEGLEAFTRYWFERLSYAYETGDLELSRRSNCPNVHYCAEAKRQSSTNWHSGRSMVCGWEINNAGRRHNFEPAADGNYQVAVQVLARSSEHYYNADGKFSTARAKPAPNTGNVATGRLLTAPVVQSVSSIRFASMTLDSAVVRLSSALLLSC